MPLSGAENWSIGRSFASHFTYHLVLTLVSYLELNFESMVGLCVYHYSLLALSYSTVLLMVSTDVIDLGVMLALKSKGGGLLTC
jgi:hypothetical protein